MSAQENKAIIYYGFDEAFNKGNLDILDEIFAPNCVGYDPTQPEEVRGPKSVKQIINGFRTAFPDIHVTIEDQIAEGDKVVSHWTIRGTHQGDFAGMPPTGKQVTVTAIVIDRFCDGKIIEYWAYRNDLGMLQQLGIIPQLA